VSRQPRGRYSPGRRPTQQPLGVRPLRASQQGRQVERELAVGVGGCCVDKLYGVVAGGEGRGVAAVGGVCKGDAVGALLCVVGRWVGA